MKDLNVYYDPSIVRYLEKAAYIACSLSESTIRTAHFVMAAFAENEIFASYFESLTGGYFSIREFLMKLASTPEDYNFIFSKDDKSEYTIDGKKENLDYNFDDEDADIFKDFTLANLKALVEKVTDIDFPKDNSISVEDFDNKKIVRFFKNSFKFLDFAPLYSENLGNAMTDAINRCTQAGKNSIDFPNLLYSITNIENSSAQRFLEYMQLDPCDIIDNLEYYFNICPEYDENNPKNFVLPAEVGDFCEILNDKYCEDVVCDILGRDTEINNFWIIASRKTKKNSILTGIAGCGKTAIVEAITMQIVNKTAPKQFLDYTIISLNLTSMIAGTMYRGQFEEKAKNLIEFLKNKSKIILFIDEIHQVMGAGSTSSNESFNLAGVLKPILARDDAIVIGATTTDEYERFVAKDAAFKRRFERIKVEEPKISELKPMIKKKVENLSKYHKVSISEDLLDYIIIQAYCFNPETANPDKTISLCDSAMAVAKSKGKKALSKIHVDEVNSALMKHYKELSETYRLCTAYHEAGHYVMSRILPTLKSKSTIVVSIIPFDNYAGINSFEFDKSKLISDDFQYFKENMILLMAGRVCEEYFMHTINSGASKDLAMISSMVRDMILKYGMDPNNELFNLSLLGYNEDDATFVTEDTKKYVIEATKKYVDTIYTETKKLVKEHKTTITRIAKSLMRRGMLDKNQLDKLFNGKSITDVELKKDETKKIKLSSKK